MPSISVIIPTWNRVQETQFAVESVINQTYQDFEVIIADDGSTDETKEVFEHYSDMRVKYLQLPHSGIPAVARNAALREANGEYVAFLDSDDLWLPNKLATQIGIFNSVPDTGMVCSNAYRVVPGEVKYGRLFFPDSLNIENPFVDLLRLSNFVITSTVLVRKEVVISCDLFSEDEAMRALEDFDLWVRIGAQYHINYSDEALAVYQDTPNSSVRSEVSLFHHYKAMLTIYRSALRLAIKYDRVSKLFEQCFMRSFFTTRQLLGRNECVMPYALVKEISIPVVSIILPVFNGEKYILDAVSSILLQTYTDYELIVINDGSQDNTLNLLNEIRDTRVRIINQPNQGLVSSLNIGLSLARGEYIARIDHDDLAYPTRLAKQVLYLEKHTECALVGTWAEIWEEDTPTSRTHCFEDDDLQLTFRLLFDNPFVHSSIMFRKKLIMNLGGYDSALAISSMEDYDLWSRISRISHVANIPELLQIYREVGSSISRATPPQIEHRYAISLAHYQAWIDGEIDQSIIRYLVDITHGYQNPKSIQIKFFICRQYMNNYIEELILVKGGDENEFTKLNSFVNELAWLHFTLGKPFSLKIIRHIDEIYFHGHILKGLEHLEKDHMLFLQSILYLLSWTYRSYRYLLRKGTNLGRWVLRRGII